MASSVVSSLRSEDHSKPYENTDSAPAQLDCLLVSAFQPGFRETPWNLEESRGGTFRRGERTATPARGGAYRILRIAARTSRVKRAVADAMIPLTSLQFWADEVYRSPSEEMALDEALFDEAVSTETALLRCYHWDRPAVTLGYFSPWEIEDQPGRTVRRWTGGGRVEHGEDLTFALAIPRTETFANQASALRYSQIHDCLKKALSTIAIHTVLEPDTAHEPRPPGGPAPCFASPVSSDLMSSEGAKIAGGAQRRVAGAILHQGSVRLPLSHRLPSADWLKTFRQELASENRTIPSETKTRMLCQIEAKRASRYDQSEWNRRRESKWA